VANHSDENYGTDTTLQVDDDSGVYDALLRFDLSDIIDDYATISDVVASATLRLFCTDGSDAGGILGKTTHSDWDETSVTWSSAPSAYGAPIHSLGLVEAATWYEIDVTSLFADGSMDDAVSLRLTSKSWNRASYSSKEGSEPPQLIIRMQGGGGGDGDDDDDESDMEFNMAEATVCTRDIRQCSDGSIVSRVAEDACNFAPCPDEAAAASAKRLFFPVWGTDGSIGCMDDSVPPTWASGAYLKESKDDCCKLFFSLQVDECLEA
jgi:hypothetical protein